MTLAYESHLGSVSDVDGLETMLASLEDPDLDIDAFEFAAALTQPSGLLPETRPDEEMTFYGEGAIDEAVRALQEMMAGHAASDHERTGFTHTFTGAEAVEKAKDYGRYMITELRRN